MKQSEVFSWRLSPKLRHSLEQEASARGTTLSDLLRHIAEAWLSSRDQGEGAKISEVQQRLYEAAAPFLGSLDGGDPHRAEEASERLRAKLLARRKIQDAA